DQRAAIVDREEPVDDNIAGRDIDVDDGDIGAERERESLRIVEDSLIKAGFEPRRDVRHEMSEPGYVLPRHRACRAAVSASGAGKYFCLVTDVLRGRPEGVGGEPLGFSEDLLAALMNRAPADRHRSGVERALAEFDGRGVSFGDFDVIWPQAERVGGDLRVAGGAPPAVVGGADV